MVVLLIRCVTCLFEDSELLELSSAFNQATVLYNNHFSGNIATVKALKEFCNNLLPPATYPHVSIYYPLNAQFESYDTIVVMHQTKDKRNMYGFQLKAGKQLPDNEPASARQFTASYVIRGKAHARNSKPSVSSSQWITPTEQMIKNFFWVLGEKWVPREWDLMESRKRRRETDVLRSLTKITKMEGNGCCKCTFPCPSPFCANI
jgi:hypothetical protein